MTIEMFISIMAILFIVFLILLIQLANPKTVKKQFERMPDMFDEEAMGKMMGKSIKTMNNVLDENEEDLKNISTKGAKISSEGVEITARAIKKGLTEDEKKLIFCKYCGEKIEEDSTFCKYCGKEQ